MKIRHLITVLAVPLLFDANLFARPLLTEEVATVGKKSFETTFSLSERVDRFNTPEVTYRTFNFPVSVRLGLHRAFELGMYFTYISQRLEAGSAHFSGSTNGRLSPFFKLSPWDNLGFQFIYHTRNPEEGVQDLPVVLGEDFEAIALLKLPVKWPVTFNVGYLLRGNYKSKLGVSNGPVYIIEPGDIFETKAALEIPIKYHFSFLGELAYYTSQTNKIAGIRTPNSAAKAMDGLLGLTWTYGGWNLGAGAAFGLLEEKYTSFNLERGAGDVLYKATASYKLTSKKRTP